MRYFRSCCLLLLALLLKSCEVPDVHPFTQATKDMAGALDESLQQVVADLKKTSIPQPVAGSTRADSSAVDSARHRLQAIKVKLDSAAHKFGAVAHGFDAYAKALDDVAAAGENKQQAIAKVNEALTGLAGAVPAYGKALQVGIKGLGAGVMGFATRSTINKLSDLASPAQDSLVQQMARYLRRAMTTFAAIDAEAQGLLRRHQQPQEQTWQDLYNSSLNRQQQANAILALITQAQYYLLLNKGTSVLEYQSETDSGLIQQLIDRDQDDKHLIRNTWKKANYKVSPGVGPKLLADLAQREKFYQPLATLSPALRAWAARARPQPTNVLAKTGPLLATWASTHHKLRASLVDARRISSKEALTYLSAAQDLQKEINALKEAQK